MVTLAALIDVCSVLWWLLKASVVFITYRYFIELEAYVCSLPEECVVDQKESKQYKELGIRYKFLLPGLRHSDCSFKNALSTLAAGGEPPQENNQSMSPTGAQFSPYFCTCFRLPELVEMLKCQFKCIPLTCCF